MLLLWLLLLGTGSAQGTPGGKGLLCFVQEAPHGPIFGTRLIPSRVVGLPVSQTSHVCRKIVDSCLLMLLLLFFLLLVDVMRGIAGGGLLPPCIFHLLLNDVLSGGPHVVKEFLQ